MLDETVALPETPAKQVAALQGKNTKLKLRLAQLEAELRDRLPKLNIIQPAPGEALEV